MTSETSDVYYGSIQHGRPARYASIGRKLDKIVEKLDFSTIKEKDKVAIKMHLGFNEGYQTVPVFFVRKIVKAVKDAGGYPFVTDNPTAVYNAVDRGYTSETCGCPIIPVAGVKDGYTKTVEFNFGNVDTLELSGVLHDADVLIDLAHAKGHNSCGFGGVVKNIALGGYHGPSRWTKLPNMRRNWSRAVQTISSTTTKRNISSTSALACAINAWNVSRPTRTLGVSV
ncbi:MAG: DUF362 domain-containing protein [Candidatus Thorarchaeota archaeon]|jgi:uncharacterized Fe-S center protein